MRVTYLEVANLGKWGKGSRIPPTDQLYEVFELEFYDVYPHELRMWMSDQKLQDLRSASSLANEFVASRAGSETRNQG